MKQMTCHWKYCRTKIKVDNSIEKRQSFFTVVGFCPLHHEALKIATKLDQKFCKRNNIDWPIGSLSYKKHQKAFTELRDLAVFRAKEIVKNG